MTDSQPTRQDAVRARLEDERNELMNSFGRGSWADGLTRDRIRLIDERLAALPPSDPATPQQSRKAAEGTGHRVHDATTGETYNSNEARAAPPQPAPDAVREALANWLEKAPVTTMHFYENGDQEVVRPDYLLASDVRWIITQCRSAPVPSPDDRFAKLSNAEAAHIPEGVTLQVSGKTTRELINERLPPSGTGAAEPVAWRCRHVNDSAKKWIFQEQPIGKHSKYLEVEPLYAAPPVRAEREALKPFADFGISDDGKDIRDGLMRDRICDWFGPSDFDAARVALSLPVKSGAGEGEHK